jgi:hypothetical protein
MPNHNQVAIEVVAIPLNRCLVIEEIREAILRTVLDKDSPVITKGLVVRMGFNQTGF